MKSTRPYEMRARADAKAQTRARILLAVRELAEETLNLDPTLDAVAARAGVSVQTVLRHFGTRDGLFDAALEAATESMVDERAVPVGDVPGAVQAIVDHYELRGDFVIRLLAREEDDPRMAQVTARGRVTHREWVDTVFAPKLPPASTERDALVDLLVVATDVYTWKLLRRDRGLSRADAEGRMQRLIGAILSGGRTGSATAATEGAVA